MVLGFEFVSVVFGDLVIVGGWWSEFEGKGGCCWGYVGDRVFKLFGVVWYWDFMVGCLCFLKVWVYFEYFGSFWFILS